MTEDHSVTIAATLVALTAIGALTYCGSRPDFLETASSRRARCVTDLVTAGQGAEAARAACDIAMPVRGYR